MKATLLLCLAFGAIQVIATESARPKVYAFSLSDGPEPGDVPCYLVFEDNETRQVQVPAKGDAEEAMRMIKLLKRLDVFNKTLKAASCGNGTLPPNF